ncbi:MAG: efflux RND transporter permease subunit [Gammaproteobacteria bacterium]|nr:efflux RND transporter permease subunit [Gammaproteobacteria bacterium]
MSSVDPGHGERPGPIAYMAGNGVAANLLMVAILAAGLVSLTGLEREAWPPVPFNMVEVSMAYPGANPEEVEQSIIVKIEEQVEALDDVKSVRSVAAPGIASVSVEVKSGTDINQALDDVESAVSRIQSFPGAAERPRITEMTSRVSIIRLIVYGDTSRRSLKELAYQIEDELAALPTVSNVETTGTSDYEISIEVPLYRLRALGLTLDDVAGAVRRGSLDLSAGSIKTRTAEVRVRTLGQRYSQQDFENIVVLSRSDGTVVHLGDIAEVHDDFRDDNLIIRHNGKPAVFVEAYRVEGEPVMDVALAVQEHVANVIAPSLPEGVEISIWNDDSQTYSERVAILLKNGLLGLLLVLVALALFLEIQLAIWVAVGLATSGIGALAVMLAFDLSLNNISLFVFVLAIGIIVDDAIVVAEHIHQERQQGRPGVAAAIRGVRRIKKPLTFAVLTSIAAFTPVLFVPGGIGEIWRALPVVVIAMLFISLVDSLFILPNHLSRLHGPDWAPTSPVERFFWRTQRWVDSVLNRFVEGPLDQSLHFATRQPAVVLAGAVGMLILSISLLPAGIVATTYADVIEGDFVTANLEMPDGTTARRTHEVARELEQAGRRVIARFSKSRTEGTLPLLSGVTVTVGQEARVEGGGVLAKPTLNPKSHIAAIELKLVSAQERDISTVDVAQAWREEVGILPYVRGIDISGEVIDFGSPIEAVLSHPDPGRLVRIADSVVSELRGLEGVYDIRSDHTPGVREIQLGLREEARTLGLTLEDLALQARAAFFGAEALRVQRDREEVRVYVRLPEDERDAITDLEEYLIRTPSGAEVPLTQVARLTPGISPPEIRRRDGQRVVTVIAEVDSAVISANEANSILANSILADLQASNPGLTYIYGGEQQQQIESLGALFRSFILVLLFMYAMLAIPLRSYSKPIIVMAIIPFGLIGTIVGHWVLGVPVSATSMIGFFGLSGVVVNDSLVMIDFVDQRLRDGVPARKAVIDGAKKRFRPIMLTSLTTFLGFTPLILERAIQAQFLAPFAATLGVGILITTAILMICVPALLAIYLRVNRVRRN